LAIDFATWKDKCHLNGAGLESPLRPKQLQKGSLDFLRVPALLHLVMNAATWRNDRVYAAG
jgi:hypothetical protein